MTADRLKAQLADAYSLAEATYKIAGFSLRITCVADSYALLDRISPEEFVKDEQMPYWAEIWPSSFVLSNHLVGEIGVEGKRCIELGAGVGVVGIALRKAGARVLVTDYATEALDFIKLNALQNGIALDERFEVMQLDWRDIRLAEQFDLVCAADVLYERRNLLPILLAIDKLLNLTARHTLPTHAVKLHQAFSPLPKKISSAFRLPRARLSSATRRYP